VHGGYGVSTSYEHGELTERIIGAAYTVHNELGVGFVEKIYENALAIELREQGLAVEQQVAFTVTYKGQVVGQYVADIVVDGKVIVETKAVSALDSIHEAQVIDYLRASGVRVGLLLNFHQKVQPRRLIV
jgi:GxxExxY protein